LIWDNLVTVAGMIWKSIRERWVAASLAIVAGVIVGGFGLWSASYYPRNLFANLWADWLPGAKVVVVAVT
jgi:hypothetical protein